MSSPEVRAKECPTPYQVRLAVFEGPLDLLLQLVERRELDITQVSLALVTDQYLQYIQELEVVQAEELTEFLLIAAQLLLIKSRLLLPAPTVPALDDEAEESPGQALVDRLEAYRRYKIAAQQLRAWGEQGQRAFVRSASPIAVLPAVPQGMASPGDLVAALQVLLAPRPPAPSVSHVVSPIAISITDQMAFIRQRLQGGGSVWFHQLFSSTISRMEVLVTFLALLELMRRSEVVARQEKVFGEILIASCRPEVQSTQPSL